MSAIKVCLVAVCYNSYSDAERLLSSINTAYNKQSGINLTVVLSDNSTIAPQPGFYEKEYSFKFSVQKNDNIGYFPAFYKGVQSTMHQEDYYDYVMVSNVDLIVDPTFFVELKKLSCDDKVGVIAPRIISDNDGRDLNPKIKRRPTKTKINIMRMICSNYLLFYLHQTFRRYRYNKAKYTAAVSQRKGSVPTGIGTLMYGAHGCFMIFTRAYFLAGASINYPRFLFGEEVFVAEQSRQRGLLIKYFPELKIYDREHASTSKENIKFICNEHRQSYDYILNNFMR